jgi:hypothetical protein
MNLSFLLLRFVVYAVNPAPASGTHARVEFSLAEELRGRRQATRNALVTQAVGGAGGLVLSPLKRFECLYTSQTDAGRFNNFQDQIKIK